MWADAAMPRRNHVSTCGALVAASAPHPLPHSGACQLNRLWLGLVRRHVQSGAELARPSFLVCLDRSAPSTRPVSQFEFFLALITLKMPNNPNPIRVITVCVW